MRKECMTETCDLVNSHYCGKKAKYIVVIDDIGWRITAKPICKEHAKLERLSGYPVFKLKRKFK